MQIILKNIPNLTQYEGIVKNLIIDNNNREKSKMINGIIVNNEKTKESKEIYSNHVILTTGTFLGGKVFISQNSEEGGRYYKNTLKPESTNTNIVQQLQSNGFEMMRLKTGTPPRIDIKTINFDGLLVQESDNPPIPLSFLNIYNNSTLPNEKQFIKCYKTATNERTHDIIRKHLSELPSYDSNNGDGIGPRYCPSIDKKITMFPTRDSHIIWLEPEDILDGDKYLYSNSVYPNGCSIAMKYDTQLELLHTIKGLEECKIIRPGYSVEYYFSNPQDLYHTLESKLIKGLYLAGQINGTTGYEEAAGQGIVAGINASLDIMSKGKNKFIMDRSESMIGVMIDDLISNGTKEPYRMFTSRCEYRLLLRQDNSDYRLTKKGYEIGCVSKERYDRMVDRYKVINEYKNMLKTNSLKPSELQKYNIQSDKSRSYWDILLRPNVTLENINKMINERKDCKEVPLQIKTEIETECKYENYLIKQQNEIESYRRQRELVIPDNINYKELAGISIEEYEKLNRIKPLTIYDASKIEGIRPHTLMVIINKCHRMKEEKIK